VNSNSFSLAGRLAYLPGVMSITREVATIILWKVHRCHAMQPSKLRFGPNLTTQYDRCPKHRMFEPALGEGESVS
jgi:hypothetical protein